MYSFNFTHYMRIQRLSLSGCWLSISEEGNTIQQSIRRRCYVFASRYLSGKVVEAISRQSTTFLASHHAPITSPANWSCHIKCRHRLLPYSKTLDDCIIFLYWVGDHCWVQAKSCGSLCRLRAKGYNADGYDMTQPQFVSPVIPTWNFAMTRLCLCFQSGL